MALYLITNTSWTFSQVSYYNETHAVRFSNKKRNCDSIEQPHCGDLVPEGQSINFYSGHQLFLTFGPTWNCRRVILMTWDKQKSIKRKRTMWLLRRHCHGTPRWILRVLGARMALYLITNKSWTFSQVSYYNETHAVRFSNKKRNWVFIEQLDLGDLVPEGQSINFYSGHQVFLRFRPTCTFRRIILMTWDKLKSNKRIKQGDFCADIAMARLHEFCGYLRLVWRFT